MWFVESINLVLFWGGKCPKNQVHKSKNEWNSQKLNRKQSMINTTNKPHNSIFKNK